MWVLIQLRWQDIDTGWKNSYMDNPVCHAANQAIEDYAMTFDVCEIYGTTLTFEKMETPYSAIPDYVYDVPLPIEVVYFLTAFEADEIVGPFDFFVDIPLDYIGLPKDSLDGQWTPEDYDERGQKYYIYRSL